MNFQLDSLLLVIFSDFVFSAARNDPKVNCERSTVVTNKPMAGIAFALSCTQTYDKKMVVDYHLKFCNAFPEDDQIQIKPGLLPGHWQTPYIAHESDPRLFTSLVSDIMLQVQRDAKLQVTLYSAVVKKLSETKHVSFFIASLFTENQQKLYNFVPLKSLY